MERRDTILLFHGTDRESFDSIIKAEAINVATEENTTYSLDGGFKTEFGYVYLTDSPLVAIDFGNRRFVNRSLSSQNIELAVICVNLNESCLEIDIAETENPTSTVLGAKYFRVGKDVCKDKFVKYAIFNFENYNDCCQYYDNPDNMINIKWNEI